MFEPDFTSSGNIHIQRCKTDGPLNHNGSIVLFLRLICLHKHLESSLIVLEGKHFNILKPLSLFLPILHIAKLNPSLCIRVLNRNHTRDGAYQQRINHKGI